MTDENIINLDDARIKKLKNLRPYRNKTEDEIREIFANRLKPKVTVEKSSPKDKPAPDYDARFKSKLQELQKEFSIDMNNSNDAENLKDLVRQQIQLENVVRDIETIQKKDSLAQDDYLKLEKLGKFQSGLLTSKGALEDKLGISRKFRKEKQVDDIPQFFSDLLSRSKTYYDKQTIQVRCPTCKIELVRLWLNFPNLKNDVEMSLECYRCKETILWSR